MRRFAKLLLIFCAALWLNNTNLFVSVPEDRAPRLIAHRGVHQIYAGNNRTADTCRAPAIAPLTHNLIENTLPSMQAAFASGADVVEIDVHLTTDGIFAVFHDWTLDCQTNGTGVTHKHSFADLQKLDIGHGFSPDGKTFPLRGTGIGLMPSLTQVLSKDGQYLINFKSNRTSEGKALTELLKDSSLKSRVFGIYGGQEPTSIATEGTELPGFDRAALKSCAMAYVALGWSGYVPPNCRDRLIAVPMNYAPYLWGWPHRFTARMQRAGTQVILWGPYDGSGFSSGIDDAETLARVPPSFDGYLWTNRIEVIGPLVTGRPSPVCSTNGGC